MRRLRSGHHASTRALGLVALVLALVAAMPACTATGTGTRIAPPAVTSLPLSAGRSSQPTSGQPTATPLPGVAPAAPKVGAPSVIVEDLDTGAILFAKHPNQRRPIASLTKIMTAMVVLGTTQPTEVVTVSKLAARQQPTTLGLKPGERMDVHDLLYALMLHSSNDVAVALAQHVSGSVGAFDDLMTRQGIDIGLADSVFTSPSGLNDDGYSTARDVAAMTRWAYASPTFASIVVTKRYTLTMPSGDRVHLRNLNDLLFDYPGAIGAKTGFTYASHWSLAGVAERGGTRLLVVLLGDPNKPFLDGEALLDWGFRVAD